MRLQAGLLVLVCLSFVNSAGATVVTFDDLSGTDLVPDGYGGINWGGNWTYYDTPQAPYAPNSGSQRIYESLPEAMFTFVTPNQVFDGAWFSGYSYLVSFNLYNDSSLVWSSGTLPPSSVPAFLASGYSGAVDAVGVVAANPNFFVMDDVTYGSGSTVPEPASMLLLAGGLMSLVRVRRSA